MKSSDVIHSELIPKIEHERDFQMKQAKEFGSGIYKNEIIHARYDQAAKILDWVLSLLKDASSD